MKKKHLDIHLEADWGSDFQEKVWGWLLENTIYTLAIQAKTKHKKNIIHINGKEIKSL